MYTGQCIHKYINPTYQELKHFRKRHKTFKETPAIQIYRTLHIHEKGKKKKRTNVPSVGRIFSSTKKDPTFAPEKSSNVKKHVSLKLRILYDSMYSE